jgi:hypothetical protein
MDTYLTPDEWNITNELVSGDQNNGVYRHISASVGIPLKYGGGSLSLIPSIAQTLFEDLPQYIIKGRSESKAEMKGNIAGMSLVPAFQVFFNGRSQADQLRNTVKEVLCGK